MDSQDIKELSPEEMSQVIGGGSDLKNYYTYLQQKYGNLSKDVMKLRVTSAEYAYWVYLSQINEGKRPDAVPCPPGYNPPA